jgi:hypothetical protein
MRTMATIIRLANSARRRPATTMPQPTAHSAAVLHTWSAQQESQSHSEGVKIAPLVFRCPATAADIESGIETDLQTFRRIGDLSIHLRCRACRSTHLLKVADGCLVSYRLPPYPGDRDRPASNSSSTPERQIDREAERWN